MITELKDNEVFVFGSNEAGIHGAGAAKQALEEFGAEKGKGFGWFGQSYGIPTKDYNIRSLPLPTIEMYTGEFLRIAKTQPDITFLVTAIGCGLAGYKPKDIAPKLL